MQNLIISLFLVFSCHPFAGEYTPMEGYSTAPLNTPVFNYEKVVVDSAVFNNWLNANYSQLDSVSMKRPREHLYYLLSSYVSELNKTQGLILPKEHDLILETLLSWAERLGVYGAHLFYNKVKSAKSRTMPELMEVSEGIKISTDNDMYKIQSVDGTWSIKFPYYFMIGIINEFVTTNGMATQLVSFSTGAAKDKTQAGRSQSTLMFIHSPRSNTKELADYWLSQFEISANTKATALGISSLESFYTYNEESQLHTEIAFLTSQTGAYLVAYSGMDGAFQANRQHFLDFILQVNTTQVNMANELTMSPLIKSVN